jgi:hypothetical protein
MCQLLVRKDGLPDRSDKSQAKTEFSLGREGLSKWKEQEGTLF